MKLDKNFIYAGMSVICIILSSVSFAGDDYQAEMQNRLNQEVLSKSFNVQDDATLTKSDNEATERGKPTKSKTQDSYYRYRYNGFYYPHPYSYYGYSRYWY